jgi:hypothetical protein
MFMVATSAVIRPFHGYLLSQPRVQRRVRVASPPRRNGVHAGVDRVAALDVRIARPEPRNMRALHGLFALLACLTLTGPAAADTAGTVTYELDWTPAERIVIEKARRKLTLIRADNVVREFDISLGGNPVGPKLRSGDSRTPEGDYVIDAKNLYSNYYLAVHLSYPNTRDVERARKLGVNPGNNIMIHGMPNGTLWPYEGYIGRDWTDGCIAVSNAAMQEIWLATRENTPVEILP